MTDNATVREWLREQGRPVSARGRVSADVVAEYEAAHPLDPQDDGDSAPVIDIDIPLDVPPGPADVGPAPVPAGPRKQEVPPQGPRRRRKIFDRTPGKDGKPQRRVSLESLGSWAWGLAGMALQQAPRSVPIGRMLALQAPIAGVVVDDLAKGTAVDRLLQPFARSSEKAEKTFALLGPPILVGMISSKPELFPVLSGPLKVALLSWAEISEPAMRKAEAKARAMSERMGEFDVDAMVAALFADVPMTGPSPEEEAAIRRAQANGNS